MKKALCILLTLMVFLSCFSVLVFAEGGIDLFDQKKVLLIQDNKPWDSDANTIILNNLHANYNMTTTSNFKSDMLKDYGVVILANDQTTATYGAYERFTSELETFAKNGGTVVYGACDAGWGGNGSFSGKLPGGVVKNNNHSHNNYVADKNHPIITGALTDNKTLSDDDLYGNLCSHTAFEESTLPIGCNIILRSQEYNEPTLIEYPLGEGLIIASGLTWEHYYAYDGGLFAKKSMDDYFAYAILHYNSTIDFTVDNVKIHADFKYNDTFFNQSSYIYNHELAKASVGLATAAMISDKTYQNPAAAEKLFNTDLKFNNYKPYNYTKVPTANSIACVVANKNIDSTKTTVIAIAIRGGGYEAEWGGNFNVGNGSEHQGFSVARDQVISCLNDFLKDSETKISYPDNIKFWITGYSRSAAVANLVAAYLDNRQYCPPDNTPDSVQNLTIYPSNVFAYTFETPRNTRNKTEAKKEVYNNIFNIVNREDPVPRLAPSLWGYVRYGKDCYLPSRENSDSNYKKLLPEMKRIYAQISLKDNTYPFEDFCFYEFDSNALSPLAWLISIKGFKDLSFVTKRKNSMSKGAYFDGLVNILAKELGPQDCYTKYFEETFVAIGEKTKFDKEKFSDRFERAKNIEFDGALMLVDSDYRSNVVALMLNEALYDTNISIRKYKELAQQVSILNILKHPNYLLTTYENKENLIAAHYTQETIAWMFAIDGDYKDGGNALSKTLTGGETYRIATINCPVDINVYDADNNLRASIINDEVAEVEDNPISACVDDDGQKVLYLPNDGDYTIKISGNGNGTMSCSFADYDFDAGEKLNATNYYDIPITPDTQITANVDEKSENGIVDDVDMTDDVSQEDIAPSEVLNYNEQEKCSVNVSASSDMATVVGEGQFYKGEFANVSVVAPENAIFLGWYENNKIVSKDYDYKFRVERNIDLVARFLTVSISDITLNYKSSSTIKPVINSDEGASYTKTFTSSDTSVATVDYNSGKVTSVKQSGLNRGSTVITCTVTDSYGNTVSDTCKVTVQFTAIQWIIKIVLFGWIWY